MVVHSVSSLISLQSHLLIYSPPPLSVRLLYCPWAPYVRCNLCIYTVESFGVLLLLREGEREGGGARLQPWGRGLLPNHWPVLLKVSLSRW